jgi:LmbE family N-acetylglucosaminyl deacetylase
LAALDGDTPWDAMLCDIGLPGPSGFDLVSEVKARRPDLPIALMTADASLDVAVRALRSEVDDFLEKPIAPAALIDQVSRLIERSHRNPRTKTERVMAIGAHPDDVEIGVGGVLFGHRRLGDELAVVTMTRGARGGDQDARAAESLAAARMLGAQLFHEDLEDTRVPEGDPTVRLIEDAIAAFEPTIIYTHSINDLHQDHRNTHRATLVAARQVPSVLCYESPSATVEFKPARFVSIDLDMDAKLDLIAVYASQTVIRPYLDPELVRSTCRYWGRFGGSRYCEPFEVVRDRTGAREPLAHDPAESSGARS